MSKLEALIKQIDTIDNLNIVTFDFYGTHLQMMSLDLSEKMKVGKRVLLSVNPTVVAIGKDFSGRLSYSNQINATIQSIEKGELLSSIKLSLHANSLESIITTHSVRNMNLNVGDEVTALINASDLSIAKTL